MIESIHIKNFRGIQDGKIDRFSKINLLVGPNNSGKSAVMEMIYLANTNSNATAVERDGIRYDALTAKRDLLGFDPLERVCSKHSKQAVDGLTNGSLSKSWQKTGFMLHLPFLKPTESCKIASCGVVQVPEEDQEQIVPLWEFFRALDLPFSMDRIGQNTDFRTDTLTLFWESSLTYYQAKESIWLIKGIKPSSSKTLLYDVSTSLAHLPFEYFREMLGAVPGWTHKIAKSFERIFQLNQKFNVTFLQLQHDMSQTQGFIAPEDKVALTIDDYGDGARSAFKLLTPLIALSELATEAEPGVFIWEEPELFQNPRTLGKLLEEIALLIKDKPVQLFIATHSLDVIAQFTALSESGQIEHNDLMTFRLNLQEGQLTSSWFNVDNLKAWMEEGLDPRVWGEFKSPLQFTFQEDGE